MDEREAWVNEERIEVNLEFAEALAWLYDSYDEGEKKFEVDWENLSGDGGGQDFVLEFHGKNKSMRMTFKGLNRNPDPCWVEVIYEEKEPV